MTDTWNLYLAINAYLNYVYNVSNTPLVQGPSNDLWISTDANGNINLVWGSSILQSNPPFTIAQVVAWWKTNQTTYQTTISQNVKIQKITNSEFYPLLVGIINLFNSIPNSPQTTVNNFILNYL